MRTKAKDRKRADLIAKIEDLQLTMKTLSTEIGTLKLEVAERQVQME